MPAPASPSNQIDCVHTAQIVAYRDTIEVWRAGQVVESFVVTFGLEGLRGLGNYRMTVYVLLVLFVIFVPRGLSHFAGCKRVLS